MQSVFVQSWGEYNNGRIVGAWLDLEDYMGDRDEFWADVMEHTNNADEVMCADWKSPISWSESPCWDTVWAVQELLESPGNWSDTVRAYVDVHGVHYLPDNLYDLERAMESLVGCWERREDFGYDMAEGLEIPDRLQAYFDYDKYGRDLLFDYSHTEIDGTIYVFDNR